MDGDFVVTHWNEYTKRCLVSPRPMPSASTCWCSDLSMVEEYPGQNREEQLEILFDKGYNQEEQTVVVPAPGDHLGRRTQVWE